MRIPLIIYSILLVVSLCSCSTTGGGSTYSNIPPGNRVFTAQRAAQLNTNPPAYWDAQREFHPTHSTWGFLKRPEQDWSEAFRVILKEDRMPAPHRRLPRRDSDDHFQYRFYGYFDAEPAYDPVINRLFDVFVLTRYEPVGQGQELAVAERPESAGISNFNRHTRTFDPPPVRYRGNLENIE
jgi:hypothetical protein